MFANTKMAEVERENASLKEKAKEHEEVIAAMGTKLGLLNQQKVACEEQNRSLTEANKHLEEFSNHLEQKVIGQQASIQNIMQVHVGTCIWTIFAYMNSHCKMSMTNIYIRTCVCT